MMWCFWLRFIRDIHWELVPPQYFIIKLRKMDNIFTEEYLRNLASDKVQGDFTPFNTNDIGKVRHYIKVMLGRLSDNHNLNVEADYKSYGSGFASYINIKISKKDKSDMTIVKEKNGTYEQIDGLYIYVSLLSPYWYFGKGYWWKNRLTGGSGDSFLQPEDINLFNKILWSRQVEEITNLFDEFRYRLLTEKEVEKQLWFNMNIKTVLNDPPYTVFDCFFHWED